MLLKVLAFSKSYVNTNSKRILLRTISTCKPYLNVESNSNVLKKTNKNESKILVEGIKLHWKKFGNGPHVALMMPGLIGSIQDNFLPVTKKMDLEKFTLIGWDPPGYGKSRPPDRDVFTGEFALSRDARMAHLLMKELGYDKYSLIGWSNGGLTGALLAASFPESIIKMVMCNSTTKCNVRGVKLLRIMSDLDNWTPPQRKALLRTYEKPYFDKMLKDWIKVNEQNVNNPKLNAFFMSEMKKIRAPTLYIKSMQDIMVPMEEVDELKTLIPDFKLHKVPKGGHDHLEFLDEFVAVTEKFLSSP